MNLRSKHWNFTVVFFLQLNICKNLQKILVYSSWATGCSIWSHDHFRIKSVNFTFIEQWVVCLLGFSEKRLNVVTGIFIVGRLLVVLYLLLEESHGVIERFYSFVESQRITGKILQQISWLHIRRSPLEIFLVIAQRYCSSRSVICLTVVNQRGYLPMKWGCFHTVIKHG